jgi:hypothetical protein
MLLSVSLQILLKLNKISIKINTIKDKLSGTFVTLNYGLPSNLRCKSIWLIQNLRRGQSAGALQGQRYMSFELRFEM